jgi:hypothetical protein
VALRAPAVFAATLNATEPLPLPLEPVAIVIHDAFDEAVHAQPLLLVTATLPLPPAASTDWLAGEMEYEHGVGAAACDTVSVSPAIDSVPLRAAPELAVAVYSTLPFPVPDAPCVIDIHEAFDVAVHAQPLSACICTVLDPPAAGTDWLFVARL